MSFDADPAQYDYSVAPNVCPACFAAGETPEKLFVNLSGIQQGALWLPANGPPANGIFEVAITAPCSWIDAIGGMLINYVPSPAATNLVVQRPVGDFQFQFAGVPVCQIWMPNDQAAPAGWIFWGGFCMIVDPTVTGILTTEELLELFALPYHETLWANPRPKSNGETVYTMSSRADHTNIKILVDPTPPGTISLWSGLIPNIPDTWLLCDGTNGTPDLRDRFIVGAGTTYAPDDTGGSTTHNHTATSDGHNHTTPAGTDIAAGTGFASSTSTDPDTLTTNPATHLPPYHSLAFIQKT